MGDGSFRIVPPRYAIGPIQLRLRFYCTPSDRKLVVVAFAKPALLTTAAGSLTAHRAIFSAVVVSCGRLTPVGQRMAFIPETLRSFSTQLWLHF